MKQISHTGAHLCCVLKKYWTKKSWPIMVWRFLRLTSIWKNLTMKFMILAKFKSKNFAYTGGCFLKSTSIKINSWHWTNELDAKNQQHRLHIWAFTIGVVYKTYLSVSMLNKHILDFKYWNKCTRKHEITQLQVKIWYKQNE